MTTGRRASPPARRAPSPPAPSPSASPTPDPPRWLTAAEQAAWRGVLRMHAALTVSLSRQLLAEAGMSLQDYGVLAMLSEQPDGRMRPFALGGELGWEKSRLSHHLSRMAARGLVARERCPTDQRGWFVAITPAGRQALGAAAPGHVAAVRRAFLDRLTPAQLQAQVEIADAVLQGLAGLCDSAHCDGASGAGPRS